MSDSTEKPERALSEIIVPETEVAGETLEAFESKYSEQMREIVTQKIELPISALPAMLDLKKGQINLSPEFQRRSIWDANRRARFIESIVMNIPIPPVFLGETEYAQYVVLDGRQRLTAIFEFLRNNFKLRNLEVWKELNHKSFSDLVDMGLDKYFMRRFIPAVVVLKESSPQVKYDVFDRLNTGGVVALPMEIRNAVFPGGFNQLIHRLSTFPAFLTLWSIPASGKKRSNSTLYNRMYDIELVLRFFAVQAYQGKLKFKDFLSDFMEERNRVYKNTPDTEQEDRKRFELGCNNTLAIFGPSAFQRPTPSGSRAPNKSASIADALMNALADEKFVGISETKSEALRSAFDKLLLENPAFIKATTEGTNGKGAIETRLGLARKCLDDALKD